MADGHAPAERQRKTGVDVQDRTILHVGGLADAHDVVLRADHDLEPDVRVGLQRDGADQGRVVRDKVVRAAQFDPLVADGVEGHDSPL